MESEECRNDDMEEQEKKHKICDNSKCSREPYEANEHIKLKIFDPSPNLHFHFMFYALLSINVK